MKFKKYLAYLWKNWWDFRANVLLVLNKFNLLDINKTILINGKKVKIPIIRKIGFVVSSELWMIPIIEKIISFKKGSFIDIGVNLGQTLIKVKSIETDIKYIGFEPNPVCVFYVRELIKVNGFKNCYIVPVGISNENKLVELNFYVSDTDSAATIIKDYRDQKISHKLYVPVYDFENLRSLLQIDNISIIKIDVEGAELEVIESLKKSLSEQRPLILCEILPVYSNKNTFRKSRQEQIEKILKDLNYTIYRVEKSNNDEFKNLLEIEEIGVHSDLKLCDYLFIPSEIKSSVRSF